MESFDKPRTVNEAIQNTVKYYEKGLIISRTKLIALIKDFSPGSIRSGVDHWLKQSVKKNKLEKVEQGKYRVL